MSLLNKFKTNSYCVGGRHYSGTVNIRGAITSKGTKMLKGNCVLCRRNKSMTISDYDYDYDYDYVYDYSYDYDYIFIDKY